MAFLQEYGEALATVTTLLGRQPEGAAGERSACKVSGVLKGDASGLAGYRPQGPQHFTDAVEGGLRAAIVTISGIWLAVIAWTFATRPTPPGSWVLLAAVTMTWFAALVGPSRLLHVHVIALITTAWLQALLSDPRVLFIDVQPAVPWMLMAALSAGLYYAGRRAQEVVALVALGGAVTASAGALHDGVWQQTWQQIAVLAAFAIGDGMGAAAAAGSMRNAARISDHASATMLAQARADISQQARRTQQLDAQRILHDTVVNTLGVIRRGVTTDRVAALRLRCASDAREVSQLWVAPTPGAWTPTQLGDALGSSAVALGLQLHVTITGNTARRLPEQVTHAVHAACREALVNVARHSGVSEASLTIAWDGSVLRIDVSDQGSGGSGGIRPGHGLDIAVRAPATQAGIQVLFDSGPHGTSVRLRWEASDDDPTVNPDRALASAAFRVVTWIALIAATVTALTWSAASGSVVALLLLIAVIGLGWAAARGAIEIPVRWPIGTGLLVAAVIVIVLPAQGSPTCAAFGLGWWGADGAIAVLIVLLALTRGWAWTVAGLVALAGGIAVMAYAPTAVPPDCGRVPLALMPLELGFFAMIVIARSALLRLWQAAAANTAALNQRRLSADVAAERARAADRRVDAAVDAVIPLLNGIASGDVDPREECVTSQCAQLEETLRTLLRIGPEPSGVGDLLADLVIRALGQGNTIRLTALPSQALAYPGWLPVRLASIVDALPIGTTVTIAVIADRELVSMMMTADCHIPDDPRTAQRPGSVTFVHLAEQTLIEIRWPR